jgi:hypothetical protein
VGSTASLSKSESGRQFHTVTVMTELSSRLNAALHTTWCFRDDNLNVNTKCPFYRVPDHVSCIVQKACIRRDIL